MKHFPQIEAEPVTWNDRVTLARSNTILAPFHIEALRDEALELAAKRYCDYLVNEAIADAAQAWLDCPCDACLDEIDALLNPEGDYGPYDEDTSDWRSSPYAYAAGLSG
jgi:hypothetical protein